MTPWMPRHDQEFDDTLTPASGVYLMAIHSYKLCGLCILALPCTEAGCEAAQANGVALPGVC